jgi:GMP synthase-like glutamine amidotransferase
MRIAILLTDIDVSDFASQFPDEAQKVVNLMQPQVTGWSFHPYAVRDQIFPADILAYDGLIITGSPASVHDDRPWIAPLLQLIQDADARRVPMVGICFGHQAIALALGGEVGRNPRGWGLGTVTTDFHTYKAWMEPRHPQIRLWRWHNEVVTRLPPGAEVLGRDPLTDVSAFSIGDHVFATQHHPEITEDYMRAMLDQLEGEVAHSVLVQARASCKPGAEGALFAVWMARFFEMARGRV